MTDTGSDMKGLPTQAVNALMSLNEIMYVSPPEIGIAKRKTLQEDRFQQDLYTGGEMVMIAQTGSSFVNPYHSWLRFEVKAQNATPAAVSFGVGSMANLFEEILIESRTGVDVSRLRQAGLFIKNYQDWKHSPAWKATEGVAQGYPDKKDYKEDVAGTPLPLFAAASKTFCMRLSDLAPLFRQQEGKYLPPQLMEGLRIRIILANGNTALVNGTANAASYQIINPRIQWHVTDLNDMFKRKINEISATSGLILMYKELHQQNRSVTSSSVNYEINKAVAKGLKCYIVPRVIANIGSSTVVNSDSYSSQAYNFLEAQAHIGNDYFPQTKLTAQSVSDINEFYTYTLHSAGYVKPQHAPVVQPLLTAGGYGSTDSLNSKSAYIVSLNRSSVNDLDGYIINNSRSLLFDFTVGDGATPIRYDSYLEYLRMASVFTSNVDIKD